LRRPIPTDFDGTIDEIAKNFVSGFTRDIATNGECSRVQPGSVTGVIRDVIEPEFF
jgi:hypothetical protein